MADLRKIAVLIAAIASGIYLFRFIFDVRVCESDARLDGKVVIVTGANTGIGKETVLDFVTRGAHVIMACRSIPRCKAAEKDILDLTGAAADSVNTVSLDLSSMESIRTFASEIKAREDKLDILVNNAGVSFTPYTKSKDGYELQMATNHLGHFLLTVLLTDMLVAAAPSRVVTVSSDAHRASNMRLDNISPAEEDYSSFFAYCNSKQANILFSAELGRRLKDRPVVGPRVSGVFALRTKGTGVTTYSLHPGVTKTEITRHSAVTGFLSSFMSWPFMMDTYHGAQTQICCAVDPRLATSTGKYYANVQEKRPASHAESIEDAKELWRISLAMTNLSDEEVHPKLKKEEQSTFELGI